VFCIHQIKPACCCCCWTINYYTTCCICLTPSLSAMFILLSGCCLSSLVPAVHQLPLNHRSAYYSGRYYQTPKLLLLLNRLYHKETYRQTDFSFINHNADWLITMTNTQQGLRRHCPPPSECIRSSTQHISEKKSNLCCHLANAFKVQRRKFLRKFELMALVPIKSTYATSH